MKNSDNFKAISGLKGISIEQIRNKRILVLAPHVDDDFIGCGGLILKALQNGSEVDICYITDGNRNQSTGPYNIPYLRKKEAEVVAQKYNVTYIKFLDIPDGKVIKNMEFLMGELTKILNKNCYDIVLY